MMLSPIDAARFLSAYKAMLETCAHRPLRGADDFAQARNAFFGNKTMLKKPPTADAEFLKAVATATFGQFIVCRHMARGTEMVGPEEQTFRVRGITTELRHMMDPWCIVDTAVMQFAGLWICDGLIQSHNIHIGPNMRKDILAKVRVA
jgi:hypothetical protein